MALKPLNLKYWAGLASLIMGLAATLFFIYLLKADHGNQLWASLGFGQQGQTLNWCSNRVASLKVNGAEGTLKETDGQWRWDGPTDSKLNYLAIEKWFAKYCQISIAPIDFKDFGSQLVPLIEVGFVDGESTVFYDLGQNRLQVDEHIFKSSKLQKGLLELSKLLPISAH